MTLQDELRNFINLTHALAWSRTTTGCPDEPGLVCALLDPVMQSELQRIVRSRGAVNAPMLLTSVFTHQTPTVRVKGKQHSVEIGDLLLIRQHFPSDLSYPISGRAILLQAKRNSFPETGTIPTGNPQIQFELYQQWPPFTGDRRLMRCPMGTAEWNFQNPSYGGSTWAESGEYLTVFDGHAYGPPLGGGWSGAPAPLSVSGGLLQANGFPGSPDPSTWANGRVPNPPASASGGVKCCGDFSALLEGVIQGSAGRRFQAGVNAGTDHWSIFINEMLNLATNPHFTFKSKNQGLGRRGQQRPSRSGQVSKLMAAQTALALAAQANWQRGLSPKPWIDWFGWSVAYPSTLFEQDLWGYTRALRDSTLDDELGEAGGSDSNDVPMDPGDMGHVPLLYVASSGPEYPEGLQPMAPLEAGQ